MPWAENPEPSRLEMKAAYLLDSGDIIYVTEFSFPDLLSEKGNPLRFDFAIFETPEDLEKEHPKFLLELQGEQHFRRKFTTPEQFRRQQSNDKRKENYCRAKGYRLVAIPYTQYNDMTLDNILEAGGYFD